MHSALSFLICRFSVYDFWFYSYWKYFLFSFNPLSVFHLPYISAFQILIVNDNVHESCDSVHRTSISNGGVVLECKDISCFLSCFSWDRMDQEYHWCRCETWGSDQRYVWLSYNHMHVSVQLAARIQSSAS